MGPPELIAQIEAEGGELTLQGESICYKIPVQLKPLIVQLREHKADALRILHERATSAVVGQTLPQGVRLVRCEPKVPPVAIDTCSVVTDPILFIHTTIDQLRIALEQPKRCVGWTVPQLIDRLEQVGVLVTLDTGVQRDVSNFWKKAGR